MSTLYHYKIGSGPVLILLHGLFGQSDNFRQIAKELSKKFTVILPDLRNHGRSFHSEDGTVGAMASDLLEFIRREKITELTLAGHSLGAKVAMQMVKQVETELTGTKIAHLFCIDMPPWETKIPKNSKLKKLAAFDPSLYNKREEIEEELNRIFESDSFAALLSKNIVFSQELGKYHFRSNLQTLIKHLDHYENAALPLPSPERRFCVPTTFVKGAQSRYYDANKIEVLNDYFLNCECVVFENCGHWVHVDQPLKLCELLQKN